MKTNIIILSIAIIFSIFTSCNNRYGSNEVILSDFLKELITLYLNDPENYYEASRKGNIIILTETDWLNYFISIHAATPNPRFILDFRVGTRVTFCEYDFVGETSYLGHTVRIYGSSDSFFDSPFFSTRGFKFQKPCRNHFLGCYNPNIWEVALYKDLSFSKMRTFKTVNDNDISLIQKLVERHFNPTRNTVPAFDSFVYQWWQVEFKAEFPLGEDYLRHFISSNFNVKKELNYVGKIPVAANIFIDRNGNATFKEISRSSGDDEIDNEAIRIVEKICENYTFTPAMHRGEIVNSTYSIVFLRNDIVPK